MASPIGTALMPTQGSCLPLTEIDVFFPNLSIVFLDVRIEDVGFTANETIISCPDDIPPRIPPALFDLKFVLLHFQNIDSLILLSYLENLKSLLQIPLTLQYRTFQN